MKRSVSPPKRSYSRAFASNLSGGINSVSDSRVLNFADAEAAFNVRLDSGAMTSGYGVTATDIPAYYTKVFYYKYYDEYACEYKEWYLAYNRDDGKIYGGGENPDEWTETEGAFFSSAPSGVSYRLYGEDVFLLCGAEGMAVIDKTLRVVNVPDAPDVTSIAMHNERMFVTIGGRRNAVWFSDDLDPTNWNPELDEGGFIELEGESGRLNRAVAFGGYVYLFRDYGISRLTAYGEQSDFSVTNLFVSSGRIFADTVSVCGDRILFFASDGLYSFNGLSASRIYRNLDGLTENCDSALSCYFGGKYYLSALCDGGESLLIVADPRTSSAAIHKDINVKSFSPIVGINGETLLVCSPDSPVLGKLESGADYFGTEQKRLWRSGMTDLSRPEKRKLISEVYIDTRFDCTVTVRTEKKEKSFFVRGNKAVQRRRVNITGTKMQLEISAVGQVSVARPSVRFAVLN